MFEVFSLVSLSVCYLDQSAIRGCAFAAVFAFFGTLYKIYSETEYGWEGVHIEDNRSLLGPLSWKFVHTDFFRDPDKFKEWW